MVDPWKLEFKEDCGYKLMLSQGVYYVYKNEQDLTDNKPINYEVRKIKDWTRMSSMISFQFIDLDSFVSGKDPFNSTP